MFKNIIIKGLFLYFIIILTINIGFWALVGFGFEPVEHIYQKGYIFKTNSTVYIFAHGIYKNISCVNNQCDLAHLTLYQDKYFLTEKIVEYYHNQGYETIWLSQCDTGKHHFSIKYKNGSEIKWADYVDRNEGHGITVPFFWGLGVEQLNLPDAFDGRSILYPIK